MSRSHQQLRLKIRPVVERADALASVVESNLSSHRGLSKAVRGVAEASRNAERVSAQLRRPFGLHRVPALFLLVSLGGLLLWAYFHFFHASQLMIAVSERDAIQLKNDLDGRITIVTTETTGSRQSISLLQKGKADLAFVQGGVEVPPDLLSKKLDANELVLFFLRDGIDDASEIRKLLTSTAGQGSHTLAKTFVHAWGLDGEVEYVHDWRLLTDDPAYPIHDDIDAILVAKDPMNQRVTAAMPRLRQAGFRLEMPDIGAMQLRLPYLTPVEVREGFLDPVAHIPTDSVPTYSVATYLVARPDLTPRQMAVAARLHSVSANSLDAGAFEPTFANASEIAQGVDAIVGILVYIGLAFLALLGLDAVTYRRYFNELNTLVSLISMHQSSKDTITQDEALRQHNIEYLSICSDLLGLISVVTGYYAQENPSLLYNRLPEIIHDRCDALKINIQLKILHGLTHHGHIEEAAGEHQKIADGGLRPSDLADSPPC